MTTNFIQDPLFRPRFVSTSPETRLCHTVPFTLAKGVKIQKEERKDRQQEIVRWECVQRKQRHANEIGVMMLRGNAALDMLHARGKR
jgi:hypothetical protein